MKPLLLALILALSVGHTSFSQNHVVVIDSSLSKPISDLAFVTKSGDFRFTNSIGQIVLNPKDFPVRIIDNQYANQVIKAYADTLYLFSKVQVLNEVVAAPRDLFEYYEELQEVHKKDIVSSLPDSLYAELNRYYFRKYDFGDDREMIYQDQLHILGVKVKPGKYEWYYQIARNNFINKNKRILDSKDSAVFFNYAGILPDLNDLFDYSIDLHVDKIWGVLTLKKKLFDASMENRDQKKLNFFRKKLLNEKDSSYYLHSIEFYDTIPIRYSYISEPYDVHTSARISKNSHRIETSYSMELGEKFLTKTTYEHRDFGYDVNDYRIPISEFQVKKIILWNTPLPKSSEWTPWKKNLFDFNASEGVLEYIFQSVMERKIEEVEVEAERE